MSDDTAGANAGTQADASVAAPDVAARTERMLRIEFTGSASEYFRIWIVNLFFTLITLGIYSAWAKVRKKRYFYGSTRLDGDTFDYFGSPKAILKGRVVAVLLFVIYALVSELYPTSRFVFMALLVLVLPWLVVRAFAFNARNSAYRGLRFDFVATPREAVPVYLGVPVFAALIWALTFAGVTYLGWHAAFAGIIIGLTVAIGYTWFAARSKVFVVSHHALGLSRFSCDLRVRNFLKIYVLAGLMLIGLMVPVGTLMGFVMSAIEVPASVEWLRFILPAFLMYIAYAVVYAYIQARTTNLLWNGSHGVGLRFASTLKARAMIRLYIGNLLAVVATAGLLIPWAVIRTLRYRLENFTVTAHGGTSFLANPALERVGAAGQEFGDIFNMDLGL